MKNVEMKAITNVELVRNKKVLNDREASAYIGMSISWLRHGRIAGYRLDDLPYPQFIKIGRSVRYLIEDLDCWLEKFKKLDHLAQTFKIAPVINNNNARS